MGDGSEVGVAVDEGSAREPGSGSDEGISGGESFGGQQAQLQGGPGGLAGGRDGFGEKVLIQGKHFGGRRRIGGGGASQDVEFQPCDGADGGVPAIAR